MNIKSLLVVIPMLCAAMTACAQNERITTVLDSEEIRTEKHQWSLISVDVRPDCTIVEKIVVPIGEDTTWICSARQEYIEDYVTGEKFFIIDSEIGFEANKIILAEFSGRVFKETYPPLPKGTQYINVSSGAKYYIKNLDMSLDVSPKKMPISNIAFFGIHLGTELKTALKELKKQGFKTFFEEEEDGLWSGTELHTYLYKDDIDYPITIQLISDTKYEIVTEAEILYQNHVDIYEVNEHIQDLADEVKAAYPYRTFKESTPNYKSAASMIEMKSGKDRIFKNITNVIFRGYYYIGDSPEDDDKDFLGTVSFAVHEDGMHHDHVIEVQYSDRKISRIIRRSAGEFRW